MSFLGYPSVYSNIVRYEPYAVKAVNKIYGDTEFSAGKYSHTGHTFEVQRIKIYNNSDCTGIQ